MKCVHCGLENPPGMRFCGGCGGALNGAPVSPVPAEPHAAAHRRTGFVTRSILCVPINNKAGTRMGVAQALNKLEGKPVQESKSVAERKLAENKPATSASAPVVVPPALAATPEAASVPAASSPQ